MKSITTLKVRYWNTVVLVSLLLCSLQSFAQDPEPEPEPSGPNVETDKPDYQPGDYVTITGSGWQPGETVSLDFHEDPKPATCLLPHDMIAVADEFGNIYNNQFLVKLNHLGVTFTLTATGQSSGLTAQTIFTDAIQLWSNPITGTNPNTANPYTTGQTVASYISVSGIGRSSGISGVNASNRYNADGWTTGNSLSSSDYFYFILTPDAGYHVRFSDFVYDAQRSGQGPRNFAFRSNANGDNFTTNVGSPDDNGASISLASSQFQNKTTATEFRFYGYNADAGTGTFSINSFVFNGSVLGTTVTALSGFSTCNNANSNAQSFVVNGIGLTPNSTITITPSVNFELSTTSAVAGFQGGGNVTLTASALGAVSGTVWVRIRAGAAVGALSEIINVSGGGFEVGDNINVSVSGTVTQVPTIGTHPQNTTITYGSNAAFSVAATGSGTLTYQWQVDTGSGSFTNLSLSGIYADTDANLATLEIALPSVSMNGYKYRVIVSGSCSPPATSNSATLTVNKADATIIVTGYTGVYDGNAHGASGTATGVASEDLSAGLNFGSSFTDVPGGTANWTFTGGTNYNDANGSVAINISKANADINVIGYTGVYDGNAHGASGTATGVASEDLSAGLNFGSSFTEVPGGTANWTFSGGTNYNDANGSVAINISKANAVINVIGYTGVYDGNTHGASGTVTGVASEDLSAGLNFGSSFTDVPGGTANWTFTGGTNYNDANGSVAINISKADAVINVIGYTGVYDGNAHGATGTATGVAGADLSAGLNFGSSFTDVPGGTANWTFSGGTNYNNANGSVAINISKADAVINVIGYTGVYDSNVHGASGTATGVASEDLSAGLNFGSSFTDVPGGTANWTFSGGTNYNNASGSVAISIGAKAVTVTAEAKSKIFGDPDPEFTYLLSEALVAGNALNGDLSREAGESAGNYAINQGDLSVNTGNYSISFVTADLTIIMPPPMSATVAKTNITCNGANDGTITITNPTGGLGIYEYRLNSGVWQASGNFTDLTAGTYNIQMRDPVRTIFSADLGNQTIVEPGVLNAQTSKTNVTCNGAANGSITILNPTGGSGSYEYRLNTGVWQSSPSFNGLAANTYSVSMRDAVNQSCTKSLGSLIISEPQALSAVCSNSNNLLYFGYAGDQTSTINVKPSGGVGPYKVSITMNRPLKCNVVNNTGDEVWVPGLSTASNVDTGCPSSGTPSLLPISTSTFTINATVGYSLNVTLMADATFTATITDSNGCITTCTTTILAEDVRCFSGNSTRPKVNICHKTGSTKNPCVSICVDDNAVAEHLAHGDFLGKCTSNCLDPNGTRSLEEETFNVKAYPNPSNSVFNLEIENGSEEEVAIEVFDISGRRIKQLNPIDIHAITFGEELPRGVYLVNVQQGSNSKTIRVVKE